MGYELKLAQIEAANRAMSSLTVVSCNKIIMVLIGFLALIWFAFIVYGSIADTYDRRADFGDIIAIITVSSVLLIITGVFICIT